MSGLILGATACGFVIAGYWFLRFWKQTGDRFFLLFGLGFFAFAANRISIALTDPTNESRHWLYLVRFAATLLIVFAIVDKNRGRRDDSDATAPPT